MTLSHFTMPNGMLSFGAPIHVPYLYRDSKVFFVAPGYGSDSHDGLTPDNPLDTLYKLHDKMVSGRNDVGIFLGPVDSSGSTGATARLSLALAQSVDSDAADGVLNWTKHSSHLFGVSTPGYNPRSRIAPPTGTYTASTFGSGNLVNVSASGCHFSNIALFHGFSTGGNSQICWTDSGNRNYYENVAFGGMADQASADHAGSRSFLSQGQESLFQNCVFGLDTVTRGAANASIEFDTTNSKRNRFVDCLFPFMCDAASPLGIIVDTANFSDRWQYFERCKFINAIGSTSTAMSALATLAASIGGHLIFDSCVRHGITEWGTDATSRNQMYIVVGGSTPNGHTAGESVVASTS